uniref:Uncharacterized protein n=1 Tax=Biomphalaria glabrata TaxID=6526 RepID=A0A2C9M5P1_BIOGL
MAGYLFKPNGEKCPLIRMASLFTCGLALSLYVIISSREWVLTLIALILFTDSLLAQYLGLMIKKNSCPRHFFDVLVLCLLFCAIVLSGFAAAANVNDLLRFVLAVSSISCYSLVFFYFIYTFRRTSCPKDNPEPKIPEFNFVNPGKSSSADVPVITDTQVPNIPVYILPQNTHFSDVDTPKLPSLQQSEFLYPNLTTFIRAQTPTAPCFDETPSESTEENPQPHSPPSYHRVISAELPTYNEALTTGWADKWFEGSTRYSQKYHQSNDVIGERSPVRVKGDIISTRAQGRLHSSVINTRDGRLPSDVLNKRDGRLHSDALNTRDLGRLHSSILNTRDGRLHSDALNTRDLGRLHSDVLNMRDGRLHNNVFNSLDYAQIHGIAYKY